MTDRVRAALVTLSFVRSGDEILLIRRAPTRDRFAGMWNGLGGHVRPREDVREAARREIREEAGIDPRTVRLRGLIHESGLLGTDHLLLLFTAEVDPAEARLARESTDEGELGWFRLDQLPWADLVPDLRTILPRLIEGEDLLLGTQEFDGGDRYVSLRLASQPQVGDRTEGTSALSPSPSSPPLRARGRRGKDADP